MATLEEETKRAKTNKKGKKTLRVFAFPFCLFCFSLPFLLPLPKELTGVGH
jgi:hypothetical protein